MIGRTISHYKIIAELGRGGMGVVYKAEDTTLKRTVALKFLSPHLLADPQQKTRFLHEAQAAAALDHPNISTIFEVHEADDQTFMVMAFIEGDDVGTKIESGPLELEEALDIAVQVARGLSKAHGEGIVHRDIKPGNVIITPEGQAKVVDFGLAKLATQTKLTKTGTTVGTVQYMSPEQATGGEVDHRTDIWSLGVMLYEMLTGQAPFRGDVEPAMVYSILNEDPEPVTSKRKDVPMALEDVIEKALAKDSAKRYQTMDELLSELETQHDQITFGIKERRFTVLRKLRRRKQFALVAGLVVVIAVGIVAGLRFFPESAEAIDSVAVLPLENLSGDPEQEYFVDGMTDELISQLGKIEGLRVISRTSSMQYKGVTKPIPDIARELKVDAIVEGSVRQEAGRVRITAQLIDVRNDDLVWGDSFNRSVEDIFAVQTDVASKIAKALEQAFSPRALQTLGERPTESLDAYNACLKGDYFFYKLDNEGLRTAIRYYQEAIRYDPNYARPYAAMAFAYSQLPAYGSVPPKEAYPKAEDLVLRALEIDDGLPEAHTAFAMIKHYYHWDVSGAEREYQAAIRLNPNYAYAHHQYAFLLLKSERFDEAVAEITRAIELDPGSVYTQQNVGEVLYYAGRYEEAAQASKESIRMDPDFKQALIFLALSQFALGDESKARATIGLARSEREDVIGWLGAAYASLGMREQAEQTFEELKRRNAEGWVSQVALANVSFALGYTDEGFRWLESAYELREGRMTWIKLLCSEEVKRDPRYISLLERMGWER